MEKMQNRDTGKKIQCAVPKFGNIMLLVNNNIVSNYPSLLQQMPVDERKSN